MNFFNMGRCCVDYMYNESVHMRNSFDIIAAALCEWVLKATLLSGMFTLYDSDGDFICKIVCIEIYESVCKTNK